VCNERVELGFRPANTSRSALVPTDQTIDFVIRPPPTPTLGEAARLAECGGLPNTRRRGDDALFTQYTPVD